jgi:NitT/TauT family transport system substrate-binding protein
MSKLLVWLLTLTFSIAAAAETAAPVRIGTLAFGTLSWELAVIRGQELDKAHGITLETTELASPEAGRIALQGKSVDIIVSDWIWVARQRQQGQDFTFVPFSASHGALMTPGGSSIKGLADLEGKRLGVAGGGLDKNWLLLKALARKTLQLDLEQKTVMTFGAPPLLNQALQQGKLDAVLTYWNYAAKLEAQGYRQVLDGREIQKALGIDVEVPALGYVFREAWARSHGQALGGFLKAAAEARQRLCESDAVWREVAPLTQETDEMVRAKLRQHYCAGRVTAFDTAGQKAAGRIFELVQPAGEHAGKDSARTLPAGVFWSAAGR